MARIALLLLIVLGLLVRVYQLNQVPYALNIDEAAIGYNAFSILKTGSDEHARALPLMFESFGDWKMPVYIYLTVIPVALLGLTETAARLLSLLSGFGSILLVFYIAKNLFKSTKVGLVSSLFMVLSPWSIFFSRMAIEANLANFLFLLALFLFQKNLRFLSFFLFGLTMFTYHTFLIFTPLFVLGLSLINFKSLNIKKSLVSFLIFIVIAISAWLVVTNAAGTKVRDVGFFTNRDVLYNRVEQFRKATSDPFEKTLHNKYAGLAYHFAQNYISSYNPSFLFDKGGEKVLHNTGVTGVLLLADAIFLVAGLIFLLRANKGAAMLLLLWLLAAPISSALTLDHPSSTRMYATLPALLLLSAYGAVSLVKYSGPLKVLTALGVMVIVFGSSLFWLDSYFNYLNAKRALFMGAGFKEVAEFVGRYPNHKVVWTRSQEFPYIYILFYNKIHPQDFRKNLDYFPQEYGAFKLVKNFDRFSFPTDLNEGPKNVPNFKKNTIYVERFGVHDNSVSVNLPSGEERFLIYVSDHDGY